MEKYPGLVLRPSKHRYYPYGEAACHVLGHMSVVTREDLQNDPNDDDELRQYYPNDMIGRDGVEALCDQAMRGARGRIERLVGRDAIVSSVDPAAGRDVRITLDIELQQQIEKTFRKVQWFDKGALVEEHEMHGAAVVIDVPTGQVRALVSYPTFDANRFDEVYPMLAMDDVNQPLMNRATQMAIEPGSTVKPIVGMGAVTSGLIGVHDTIECTGYLIIDGKEQSCGRCWVASRFFNMLGKQGVSHHQVPYSDPHPTGHLTLSDAIQRSCNVYFETMGDKLGLEGLSRWYTKFGLGRKTGIGLAEVAGRLPDSYRGPAHGRRSASWFSAIGQMQVLATPIQMANVAATIARDGVWIRPRLVTSEKDATTRPGRTMDGPDRVDLRIPSATLSAVKEGMWRVVNTPAGSAYQDIRRSDISLAGKTGTAQAAMFSIIVRDERGQPVRDERGVPLRRKPAISTRVHPNPQMPWYRGSGSSGTDLSHAWFIGFAPAKAPKIAFAVVLEYGGSGGHDPAPIVRTLLDACIQHGYLAREK